MVENKNQKIKSVKFGGGVVSKIMLQDKQVFPEIPDEPVGPTYPIKVQLSTEVSLSVSNVSEFYSHTPITVRFNNGDSWTLTSTNSSMGTYPLLSILIYEDDHFEVDRMWQGSSSISPDGLSVLSCTGKDGENVSYSLSLNYYNNPPTYVDGSHYWVGYTLHL